MEETEPTTKEKIRKKAQKFFDLRQGLKDVTRLEELTKFLDSEYASLKGLRKAGNLAMEKVMWQGFLENFVEYGRLKKFIE